MPVFVQVNIGKKCHVVAGANSALLISTQSKVYTYMQEGTQKLNEVTKTQSGNQPGISSYDLNLLTGFEYVWFGKLSTGVYLNYGLLNFITPESQLAPSTYKNTSVQFVLKYKLLSH